MRVVFVYAGSKVVKECASWASALELVWLLRSDGAARTFEALAGFALGVIGETFGEGL